MNNSVRQIFDDACDVALKGEARRHFYVGAIGARSDGTYVRSHNVSTPERNRCAHAEFRLAKKLDVGSVVYVARLTKGLRMLACAKPCASCVNVLRKRGVRRVYFTIDDNTYDWMDL